MHGLRVTIRPLAAFGGPLRGDSFFGQLCWAARNRFGPDRLQVLLDGYTDGKPFCICSDGLPAGYLPRPALPLHLFDRVDEERKRVKKRRWLPLGAVGAALPTWLSECLDDAEVIASIGADGDMWVKTHAQPHNSISRLTGTTGGPEFAPYGTEQHWYAHGMQLDLWLLYEPARIDTGELRTLIGDIGRTGYGRDASTGLGKFELVRDEETLPPRQDGANACMTLAPCAPQGLGYRHDRSYYALFTRFGRHGDATLATGRPFKNPVLMADTGAVLAPEAPIAEPFVGQGLGGGGLLSNAIDGTVHQGYAPCVAVRMEEAS